MNSKEQGYFVSLMIVAAALLGAGWLIGTFLLAPVHCGGPECDRWTRQLHLSLASSLAGIGCLVLAALNERAKVAAPLGAGILLVSALAGFSNPAMFVLTSVDFLLVAGVLAWFLVVWGGRTGAKT